MELLKTYSIKTIKKYIKEMDYLTKIDVNKLTKIEITMILKTIGIVVNNKMLSNELKNILMILINKNKSKTNKKSDLISKMIFLFKMKQKLSQITLFDIINYKFNKKKSSNNVFDNKSSNNVFENNIYLNKIEEMIKIAIN